MTNAITMSGFGRWGRAGNQFFQYAFLTGYADRYNCQLQLPRWVGDQLFDSQTSPVRDTLPPWKEPGSGLSHPTPPDGNELVGHDFHGYAQYHTSYFARDRARIRALFQPTGSIIARMGPAVLSLRSWGGTTIGIHLRRGDYGRGIFPVIPTSWYLRWLDAYWTSFDKPVLFISTESPELVREFRKYAPQTAETLGVNLRCEPMVDCTYLKEDLALPKPESMDWYPDFHLLSKCDVVLGPSSTFSFFAAMLNSKLQEYWRASLASEGFERTDPWDAYPSLREPVQQYRHIPGVALVHNRPYW